DVGEGRRLIDLSSHLYGSLVHAQQETDGFLSNAVFSPYTAVRILLALQQGASGRTLDELNLLLGPEGRNTETYTGLPECLRGTERFHDYSPGQSESSVCFLRLAESIYVATHEGDRRLTAYRNSISLNFGIDVRLFNFRSPVEAAREMNAYVQRRTGTLVRQVTSSEDLARGESPGIAITNVAVLQGVAWRVPFPKLLQGVFYGEGEHGEAHAQPGVDFMEVTVDKSEVGFEFLDEGSIAVLRIPFMDPRLAMFVIMPTENSFSNFAEEVLDVGGTLIDDLIGQAVVRRWQETRRRRRHEHGKLHIRLPRFRVLPGEQGGLDLLSSVDFLHLDHLTSNADFSRLSDEGQRLKVDMWRHASLIDVDQRGIMITDDDGDDSGSLRLRRRSDGRSVGPGDGDSS
ncbi:proteinase inhibitor i4 serpin, partial [Cystoisospora suis]